MQALSARGYQEEETPADCLCGAVPGEMGLGLSLKGRGCQWAQEDKYAFP